MADPGKPARLAAHAARITSLRDILAPLAAAGDPAITSRLDQLDAMLAQIAAGFDPFDFRDWAAARYERHRPGPPPCGPPDSEPA
jgi:hypothetical protein